MSNKYKLVIWHGVIAVLAWWLWGYVDYVLNVITPESWDFDYEIQPLINFIVQTSLVTIGFVLFRRKENALSLSGVVALMYLLRFGFSYINVIGIGVFILLSMNARMSLIQELDERTKIDPRLIVRRGVPAVIIGMFILISFAAYQSPVAKSLSQSDQLPSVSEAFIRRVVNTTLSSNADLVDPIQKEEALSEATRETINSINSILGPYFQYAPPTLAFGLFLVLWGLSWIFIWASVGIGVIIFWIMRKTGFVKIEEKDVKAETLIV